jgi:hypothetical protein
LWTRAFLMIRSPYFCHPSHRIISLC